MISKGIIFVIISMHMYTCIYICILTSHFLTQTVYYIIVLPLILLKYYILRSPYPPFSIHNNLFSFHYSSLIFMAACWHILKNVWDFTQPRALLLFPRVFNLWPLQKVSQQITDSICHFVFIQEYLQARLLATRFLMQRKVVGTFDKYYWTCSLRSLRLNPFQLPTAMDESVYFSKVL